MDALLTEVRIMKIPRPKFLSSKVLQSHKPDQEKDENMKNNKYNSFAEQKTTLTTPINHLSHNGGKILSKATLEDTKELITERGIEKDDGCYFPINGAKMEAGDVRNTSGGSYPTEPPTDYMDEELDIRSLVIKSVKENINGDVALIKNDVGKLAKDVNTEINNNTIILR